MNSFNTSALLDLFIQWVLPILGTIIGAALTWILALLHRKFGLDVEANHREALQTALTNAAGLLLQRLGKAGLARLTPNSKEVRTVALDYVHNAVPDAVMFFELTPADIIEKVLAKVGVGKQDAPVAPTPRRR